MKASISKNVSSISSNKQPLILFWLFYIIFWTNLTSDRPNQILFILKTCLPLYSLSIHSIQDPLNARHQAFFNHKFSSLQLMYKNVFVTSITSQGSRVVRYKEADKIFISSNRILWLILAKICSAVAHFSGWNRWQLRMCSFNLVLHCYNISLLIGKRNPLHSTWM